MQSSNIIKFIELRLSCLFVLCYVYLCIFCSVICDTSTNKEFEYSLKSGFELCVKRVEWKVLHFVFNH